MLELKNIKASLKNENKLIIDNLSLLINDGEVHAIMGPNGTGKSSLAKVIMNHYKYTLNSGDIIINGKVINDMDVSSRAKMGIFLAMQDPTVIEGVTNSEFLKTAKQEIDGKRIDYFNFIEKTKSAMNDLKFPKEMIHRSINVGFSGGEKKKNEILQLKILEPKVIILDEIDSGLDIDSLKIVCENINDYKEKHKDVSILIITHYPRILELIKPNYVHIMKDGKIIKTGDINLAIKTEKEGYND